MEMTLDEVRDDIVARLDDAARSRHSPMHTPVVATSDADARIMVLREFDRDHWTLRFHTDARAPKAKTIGQDDRVGVLFYDREGKVQIRCRGSARIECEGDLVQRAWAQSDSYAKRCYLGEPPGSPSVAPTSGLPDWLEGVRPTDRQLEPARQNFAVMLVQVDSVDWYHLAHDGHRRAIFENGEGRWLTP